MSYSHERIGVGARFVYDGDIVQIVEITYAANGAQVVVSGAGNVRRMALRELLDETRARLIPTEDGPAGGDEHETAAAVLAQASEAELDAMRCKAAHVREVLTGYRSGTAEFARSDEPRREFNPRQPMKKRCQAKATELNVNARTVERWVRDYRCFGEAGLLANRPGRQGGTDRRWLEAALEVMVEHTERSKPTRSAVIRKAAQCVAARYGDDVVPLPSKSAAYRELTRLEEWHPTFRLSTTRNRDIAARPAGPYGKLRPTRPCEYLVLDTTRLDVFALDPVTLRWVQAELTVGMDWYTRCPTGLRLTPVSTKSIDAAAVLFEAYRPRPADSSWPDHAVWPEHGLPRTVMIDTDVIDAPATGGAAGPAIVPETIVIDHGKIFVSEHLTSVCARMGISIQPVRLRTGRDKGPVERFFRTLREDLLQHLEGYKGPDLYSRGVDVESRAFYYLDELEDIIRQWVATVYNHRRHAGLVDPRLPSARMTPAMMYEHGLARSGYIEVPRDPELGYEFLTVRARTIQPYGVEIDGCRYNGEALNPYRGKPSPYRGKLKGRWPIHVDPDDITAVYFRDPNTRSWHRLVWEHAAGLDMPLSDEALRFARRLAADKYRFPDDRLALDELLARWQGDLAATRSERRLMLRLTRTHKPLSAGLPHVPDREVSLTDAENADAAALHGDDDGADEPEDYYHDALEEA